MPPEHASKPGQTLGDSDEWQLSRVPTQASGGWPSGRLLAANLWLLLGAFGSHFSAASGATALIARFFEELTLTHFALDTCVLDQLAESLHGIVYIFIVTQTQLNHKKPPEWK